MTPGVEHTEFQLTLDADCFRKGDKISPFMISALGDRWWERLLWKILGIGIFDPQLVYGKRESSGETER